MSEWKVRLWMECDHCGGTGTEPEKRESRSYEIMTQHGGGRCTECNGEGRIEKDATLAEFKAMMNEA